MDARFQPFFMLGGPILALVAGYILCKVSRKKENEEVIEELLRLREYNQQLIKKLEKEKKVIKGVRDFLQEGNKD